MYKGDSHIHSCFSADSDEKLENIIERAIEIGLDEIVITDHMDYNDDEKDDIFVFNIDDYLKTLNAYRQKYKDKINIKIGMELGIQPQLFKRYEPILKSDAYDFLIGSSHSAMGIDVGYLEYHEHFKNKDEAHRRYFEEILKNLEIYDNTHINTYGHLDFIRRYGGGIFRDHSELNLELHREIIDEILKKLIEKKIGLELNTSGIRYGLGEFHPCNEIFKRYKELGGEIITLGSDAHRACDIAKDFDKAREFLKSLGFKYFCTFTKKKIEYREL